MRPAVENGAVRERTISEEDLREISDAERTIPRLGSLPMRPDILLTRPPVDVAAAQLPDKSTAVQPTVSNSALNA